ncbi:peroxiredoxin [Nitrosomonas nitrosa]|uniref:TlpA family protein disulfide reductase n=1 Tax=Nitrosomonas nitrosa TaxID=52442 RepID=UPI000D2FE34B|nr:TlpA disulfide reductase family protein [Nitrosomonas nitrosa]PTQ94742.1 peroxiredoxin [Nitrosomonas nitrosa]
MTRYLFLVFFLLSLPVAAHFEGDTPPPHCSLNYQDGSQVQDWQAMKGQVIYIDFWASWCPPCVKSFPFMNQLSQDFKERGLQVIGVNLDEKRAEAEAFLNQYSPNFTVVFDLDKQCAKDFNVIAMPSTYIIDKKGFVRHIHRGFRPNETETMRELIDALLNETI